MADEQTIAELYAESPIAAALGAMLIEAQNGANSGAMTLTVLAAYINGLLTAGAPSDMNNFFELAGALNNDPLFSTKPLLKTGGALTGAVNHAAIQDLASAATADLSTKDTNQVRITGAVTITGLGVLPTGAVRFVRFAAALTLTHNAASLILPGGANILTEADDTAIFISLGAGNWRCWFYQRAAVAPEGAWTTWTPTVAASTPAGSGWAYTVTTARYQKRGKTVTATFVGTLTNLGTGPTASGALTVSLPFAALAASCGAGKEVGVTGQALQAAMSGGSNLATLTLSSAASALVLNYQHRFTIVYETA